jgi:hypothetical protein
MKVMEQFVQQLTERDYQEEFRILQRSTLHIDHAKNLIAMQIPDFKSQNRHDTVLPFAHTQVKLKPIQDIKSQVARDLQIKRAASDTHQLSVGGHLVNQGGGNFTNTLKAEALEPMARLSPEGDAARKKEDQTK